MSLTPTKISAIYDDLHSLMGTLFPTYEEMINPYSPESQDNLSLKASWGIEIISGQNVDRETCSLSMNRGFQITMTQKIFAGLMKTTGAAAARHTAEKELLEAAQLLAVKLQDDTYLAANNFENASSVKYESDGGLEFIRAEQFDLIMIRASIPIEYKTELGGST